jgi:predicted MFS family arabinose efflux permease
LSNSVSGQSEEPLQNPYSGYIAPPRPQLLVAACCLAGMAKSLEPQFWVFYPPHAAPFGAGWVEARHLSSISALLLVIMMIGGGMLGDFYGRRRFLLVGLGLTIVANVAAMISAENQWHVFMHVLTLLAAAVVLPLSLAPLYIHFRGKERVMAFAWYMLATTIAAVFASSLADLGMRYFGWRGAYYLPAITAAVAFLLIYLSLPESHVRSERYLDAIVYAGWTLVVLAVIFGVVQWGIVDERVSVLLILSGLGCCLGLALIIWWDARAPGNIFYNSTIRIRDMTMLIMIGVIIQILLMGFFQPTYQYFDVVKGYPLIQRTLALLPMGIGMLLGTRLVGKVWKFRRVRRLMTGGFLTVGISIALMSIFPEVIPYAIQIVPLTLFGFAYLGTKTVWTNSIFQTVIDDYTGLNAGINSATLSIGGALGSVLAGQLLVIFGQADFQERLASFALPTQIDSLFALLTEISRRDILSQLIDPTLVGDAVWQAYVASYALAYSRTLWVMGAIAFVGAATVWFGLRQSNIRFTDEEVAVDVTASVFEEIPDLDRPEIQRDRAE